MERLLLILPFRNLSLTADENFLAEGITEDLIQILSKADYLRIASPASTAFFKEKSVDLEELREELGPSHVLEGSLRKWGKFIRLSLFLSDAVEGRLLWNRTFEDDRLRLYSLQEKAAEAVQSYFRPIQSGQQQVSFIKTDDPSLPKDNPNAYEAYLKGIWHFNHFTMEHIEEGIQHFRRATELHPEFAQAFSWLAFGCMGLGGYKDASWYQEGRETALRAIAINPKLIQAHLSLSFTQMFYDWEWEAAEKSIHKALTLNPRSAEAHRTLGVLQAVSGDARSNVSSHEIATKYDPLNFIHARGLGLALYLDRRYEECIEEFERILEQDPGFYPAFEGMGFARAAQGRWEEAIALFTTYQQRVGHPLKGWLGLGYAYGKTGQSDKAYEVLKIHHQRKEELNDLNLSSDIAWLYTGMGNWEAALDSLETAIQERHLMTLCLLRLDPVLDPLRDLPRFGQLLRTCNLDQFKLREKSGLQKVNQVLHIRADSKDHLDLLAQNFLYAQAEGNYCQISWLKGTAPQKRILRLPLSKLKEQIANEEIRQVHRSTLVNLKHFRQSKRSGKRLFVVQPELGIELPVSRGFANKLTP